MIEFYTSRELSHIFNINLAKWKRWSREFLPPDPLGGLQSGYARQYNLNEAFTVFLGGHLVGDLKFTIPESRQILSDLRQWLIEHGFYFDFSGKANSPYKSIRPVQYYQITIRSKTVPDAVVPRLVYRIKATITREAVEYKGSPMQQERYIESAINGQDQDLVEIGATSYRVLGISFLRKSFLRNLNQFGKKDAPRMPD
jgi:hypothetical protein